MAVTAKFTADFTQWNAALKDAAKTIEPLKIKAEGTRQELQKMANSLSGATIQRQAQLAVAAVEKIGGVTRLTAQEQAKLNATVTEAIAKYKALGQQAPADMQALADATKSTATATEANAQSFKGMVLSYAAGIATFETVKRVIGGIGEFLTSSLDAYAQAEAGQKRLKVALQATGNATPQVIKQYSDLASQFQRTTAFSDDMIESAEAMFTQLGEVGPQDMKVALTAATDLAEGLGIDLNDAVKALSKAAEGSTTSLKKLAPSLDEAAIKGGDLATIAAEVEKHFGGQAAAALDTYSGRVKQLANDWDNVKEAIGGAIANDALIRGAMRLTSDAVAEASGSSAEFAGSNAKLISTFLGLDPLTASYVQKLYDYVDAANSAAGATSLLARAKAESNAFDARGGAAPAKATGFVADLAEARKQIAALTDAQRKEINAAIEMGASVDEISKALNKQNPALHLTAESVHLYEDSLKKGAEAGKKSREEADKLREAMDRQREADQDAVADILKVSSAIDKMFDKDAEEAAKRETEALKKFSDAVSDLTGQSGLEKALFDFDALNAAIAQGGATAEGTKKVYDEIGAAINAIMSGGAHLTGTLEEQTAQWDKLTQAAADFSALHPIEPLKEDLPVVVKETKDFDKSIGELSKALANLAQISGGTFGRIFTALSSIVGAADTGLKAFDAMKDGISQIGKKGAGLGDLVKGFSSLSTGILGAVSAAIGLGKALVGIFKKDRAAEEVKSLAKEFGVAVSKEFGQQIEDLAKNMFGGNRQAAKIFNLDQIISQGGGITAKNLGVLEDRLHDVFSLVQTGALTGSQAMTVLDKNFQTFADFLGGDVDPALKEIIRLNKEFGTGSKAILDFVAKNANVAAGGFNKIAANIAAIPGTLNRIGPIAEATFGALLDGGDSVVEALAAMGPGIDAVSAALKGAGQSATGFLAQVLGWQSIVENNKGVFDALSGTLDVLKGLNNAGSLTQDVFAQLAGTIDDAFNKLVAQGVSGTDALKLMQPQLQEIWELQKDFGYAVDAGTQALLDQAIAAGEVGEKHRSIQEQTLDVMKHLDAVLAGIGKKFGVDIPGDIDKTGAAFDRLGNKIGDAIDQIPDHIDIPIDFPTGPYQQGPPDARPYSQGGPVYAARGMFIPRGTDTVPAMLTPGEGVLSRRGMHALGQLNAGGAPATAPTVVIMQIDKREIGRAIADVLPGELRRLGVRVRT